MFFREDNYNEVIEKIKAKVEEKRNEKFIGNKWVLNGIVNFEPNGAKEFYNVLLDMGFDAYIMTDEKNNIDLSTAFYEKKIFEIIIYDNKDVFNEDVMKQQNLNMFMTKFRGILFDFRREFIWSFESIYFFIKLLKLLMLLYYTYLVIFSFMVPKKEGKLFFYLLSTNNKNPISDFDKSNILSMIKIF